MMLPLWQIGPRSGDYTLHDKHCPRQVGVNASKNVPLSAHLNRRFSIVVPSAGLTCNFSGMDVVGGL